MIFFLYIIFFIAVFSNCWKIWFKKHYISNHNSEDQFCHKAGLFSGAQIRIIIIIQGTRGFMVTQPPLYVVKEEGSS